MTTHITLVCDRSGSMGAVQSDAEGAVNQFLKDQKKVDDKATLLLSEFDAGYGGDEDWYHVVFEGDLQDFQMYLLNPRGGTALLDAVGMAVSQTNEFITEQDAMPDKIIFVVQTDGQENSSKEYKLDKIKEMIKDRTDEGWEFVFLGMGPDTFGQGEAMGIQNIVRASGSGISHAHTHSVLSSYVADYRTGHTHNLAAANYNVDTQGRVFDDEGQELDPTTGQRITEFRKVRDNPQA